MTTTCCIGVVVGGDDVNVLVDGEDDPTKVVPRAETVTGARADMDASTAMISAKTPVPTSRAEPWRVSGFTTLGSQRIVQAAACSIS
jgi:hypothetical protein